MRTPPKLVPAVVAVVAVLLATATPAGANPFAVEITGGSFTTVLRTIDLEPGVYGTPPCEEKPQTLEMAFDGDATSGTWTLSGTRTLYIQIPPTTGDWYQLDVTYVLGEGTYTGIGSPPPTATLDGLLAPEIVISHIGTAQDPDCTKEDVRCVIRGVFTITTGWFDGASLPNPQPGDTLHLESDTGTSGFPLQAYPCAPPFNALSGTDASLIQDIAFS